MRKTSFIAMLAAFVLASPTWGLAQEYAGVPTIVGGSSIPIVADGTILGGSPTPILAGGEVLVGAPATFQSGPIHPYSYYAAFPNPARTYVPYGPTDVFSFQGQAYGHAYDRWTWSAMSSASPGLGRYYQLLH